jgi:Ferritin-like domain
MQNTDLGAIEVRGTTRGAFRLRGALAVGAMIGAGAVSPFVRDALAQDDGGDVAVLNFALTLEYLEATFYERALMKGKGLSPDTRALALEIHENERAHVDALRTAIKGAGGKPVAAPEVGFGLAFTSEERFLGLAQALEDTGVGAYNGAAPSLQSAKLLRRGREHRADRGAPRVAHPPDARQAPHARGLRQGARPRNGRGHRQALHEVARQV